MLNKLNDHEREPISDIINGATKGNSQMGYWHNTSYWTLRTEGWEGFTEIGTGVFQGKAFTNSGSNKVLKRAVAAALGDCGGRVNNHRFRHSFASNLIRAGVNVKAVQQLLRHENVQITLNTYSHLLQEDLTAAANSVG